MSTIKNIIFDYGGVIFEIEHELAARSFEELGVPQVRQAFTHAAQGELFMDFETGTVSPEIFREEVRKMSERPLSDEQIDGAWNAMLLGVPEGNVPLLMQLKEKYRTFLLSNNNPIHHAACERMLRERWETAIEDCMEKAYFSHLIQLRKPDARAYRHVLEMHGLDPGETVFIDDTPVNIEIAASLGMQTRLVRRNAPLPDTIESFL
ncbi:putative hydrolase of the HAD superfamily [Anseongella ginsenosidimutans]|uniref:Putative hydrolase of the HAD superfamily n=1 Tax=Anseongella ginsenosidimutans TaxID=496056 RepID=A0A4R3KMC0_9SPHI|nr:HAD family phosphatase [Anseongella ginsenosidimutans]QEC52697.1 HAD family phosphatase [Anseongella ginsenosidimutans]TCS85445.1 putative hydrolase of the HAD superfamily [Anseongella ginsenosidimutans]